MNIQEQRDAMVKANAIRASRIIDSATYAYVEGQLKNIKERGLDPADYEVILATDEYPRIIEGPDGTNLRVTQHIRLIRREDIKDVHP